MTAVPSLDCIGRGRKEFVIQEGQGFLQVWREQLLQRLANPLEAPHAMPEPGQLLQRGVAAAATIEKAVDLVHNVSKCSQFGSPPGDAHEGAPLGGSQIVLHEQVAMLKQVSNLLFDLLPVPGRLAGGGRTRTPAAKLGFRGGQLLADLGARVQHRLRQFLDDMKLAELVGNIAKDPGNWLGIQGRTVGRDASQHQFVPLECRLERAEESLDVRVGRIVVQHFVNQAAERPVVDDGEDTKWPIVQLVCRDISREVSQRGVQVLAADSLPGLFFPRPPPNSESWQKAQTRGDLAKDANWPRGKASRPPPPIVLPSR